MKNIIFTHSKTTAKLTLTAAFTVIAALSADVTASRFIDRDENQQPTVSHYTSSRGIDYDLVGRTLPLRNSPNKRLWSRAFKNDGAADVAAITESTTKRRKTTPVSTDFDPSSVNQSTMPSLFLCQEDVTKLNTEPKIAHGNFETIVEEDMVVEQPVGTTSTPFFFPIYENEKDAQLAAYAHTVEQHHAGKRVRMAEYFEALEALTNEDEQMGYSSTWKVEEKETEENAFTFTASIEEESEDEAIYDFGIDSFKKIATPRNLAFAAGIATGTALAYKAYTEGFSTLATDVVTSTSGFFTQAANITTNTTLGFCPVEQIVPTIMPNATSTFANATTNATLEFCPALPSFTSNVATEIVVPQVNTFINNVCSILPYSNATTQAIQQPLVQQAVETASTTTGGFWNFFNHAFINLNKNSHL
ncbi:MAG: hypothetical protein ACTHJ4_06205 [Candidatus Nucleicultricaceae bacterium]